MEKESEDPFQRRKVGIKCMPRKCGVGKNFYIGSHINGSMKNECKGAFHTGEEQAELELLDELLSS